MTSDQNQNPAIDLDVIETRAVSLVYDFASMSLADITPSVSDAAEEKYRNLVRGWDAVPEAERLSPRGKALRARIMALRSFVYGIKLVASAGPVAAGRRGDVDFLPGIHNLPAPSLPGSSTGRLPPRA